MRYFWVAFFAFFPIAVIVLCLVAPSMNWWFPYNEGAMSPLGQQIDGLFYLILWITGITFVGTQIALVYVLWTGANRAERPVFTHGSHELEVIWTIVPSGILLFIALYQLDVWKQYRVQAAYPEGILQQPIAEVTARQFEWRIRYPSPDRVFKDRDDVRRWLRNPEPTDLYSVNDLHCPTQEPVLIYLRSEDVQHSFFVPELRVKQDAVPGLVIPIWWETLKPKEYEWLCAELCGWGHYKMGAIVSAETRGKYEAYLRNLQQEQFDDGFPGPSFEEEEDVARDEGRGTRDEGVAALALDPRPSTLDPHGATP
jgi:cytochrome c oxidase subunit II